MKKSILLISLLTVLVLLAGCAAQPSATSNIDQGSYITGVQLNESAAGESPSSFTILQPADGTPVGVLLTGATQGELYVIIKDESGSIVWQSEPASGRIKLNTTVTSLPAGTYSIQAAWNGPVTGTYNLYMVPGEAVRMARVSPLALVGGAGMILVALGYILYAALRRLGWGYLGLGALAWILTVAVKFLLAIPLNTPIYNALTGALPGWPGETIFNLYVGLLTGVTEVLMVWLWVRYTRKGQVGWNKALAFGIGFGAVEALLLGLNSAAAVLMAILSPDLVGAAAVESLAQGGNLLVSLAPVSERFFTVLVHIFCNVLLFYGARVKQSRFFWLAFIFKSLLDAAAAYAQLSGQLGQPGFVWIIEGVVALFGIIGYFGIRRVGRKYLALGE